MAASRDDERILLAEGEDSQLSVESFAGAAGEVDSRTQLALAKDDVSEDNQTADAIETAQENSPARRYDAGFAEDGVDIADDILPGSPRAEGEKTTEKGRDSTEHSSEPSKPDFGKHEKEKPSALENGSSTPTDDEEKDARYRIQDQTNRLPFKQLVIVFIGCSMAIMLSFLDQTIVSTALPRISADLGAADELSWVGTAYLLTSTAFQTLWSRFSDIWGRKACLLVSLVIFLIGNILCGISRNITQLIIFRAFAGIGGGGILTLVMVVISDVVSLRDRGKYQGLIGVAIAISSVIGPYLGGLFSDSPSIGWRWCFYIAAPIGVLAFLMIFFILPFKGVTGSFRSKLVQIDYLGTCLIVISTILLLLPTAWGGTTLPWSSPIIIVLFILAALSICATVAVEIWVERRGRLPIIPMRLFSIRTASVVFVTQFLSGLTYYGQLYFIPQYFQVVRQDSGAKSGLQLFPLLLSQTIASWLSGLIVSWTGRYKPSIAVGFILWAVGDGLLYTLNRTTSPGVMIVILILTGIGAGQTFQTSLVAAQSSVSTPDIAVVTGLRNFCRIIGGTFGIAICGAILNNGLVQRLAAAPLSLSPAEIDKIVASGTNIPQVVSADMLDAVLGAYEASLRSVYLFFIPCTAVSAIIVIMLMEQHTLSKK